MKKTNFGIIFLLFIFLFSCSTNRDKTNEIIINSEKCNEWNLPELNIIAEIPENYDLSYNENGGFYLQARKFNKDGKLLSEISIGRIEGEFKESQIEKTLKKADEELKNQLSNVEQIDYKTLFIGENLINGKQTKNLRAIVEFNEYQKTMDGIFYAFTTPIILNETNKFMLSSMSKETEKFNENKISLELLNFMKSIKTLN